MGKLLLIPEKRDKERDVVEKAWIDAGGTVLRIGKFWEKPDVGQHSVHLYGHDTFCLVLAQILELELISPKDEWIAQLPSIFLNRKIELKRLEEIVHLNYPLFVKPVVPKQFQGKVFAHADELAETTAGLSGTEQLICSSIIQVEKELRCFILNQKIIDLAYYEGEGDLESPRAFIEKLLAEVELPLPKTFVLDLAYNKDQGWFVLEFNASWGAGLNGCAPEKVIACIEVATVSTLF